jgi:hypothetical protein
VAYKEVLEGCADPQVGAAVLNAVGRLFENDRELLIRKVHERTIAAKFAEYLVPHFPGLDVNVDYNKMEDLAKRLDWRGRGNPDLVFPDIIVHTIGQHNNLLVMELKLDSSRKPKNDDIQKLQAFRKDERFRYRHALFMRFGVGEKGAGTISECEWV